METIRVATRIKAPLERCFLLSLSIDLHVASASKMQEKAVAGVTTGLIGEGETVTFEGRHFGRQFSHTSRIEALRPFSYFRDVMVAGVFQHFEHDHHFAPMDDGTRMRDEVRFSAPWGPLGRLVSKLFVRRWLTAFLVERNATIKRVAESEEWRQYLDSGTKDRPGVEGVGASVTEGRDGDALERGSQWVVAPRSRRG